MSLTTDYSFLSLLLVSTLFCSDFIHYLQDKTEPGFEMRFFQILFLQMKKKKKEKKSVILKKLRWQFGQFKLEFSQLCSSNFSSIKSK